MDKFGSEGFDLDEILLFSRVFLVYFLLKSEFDGLEFFYDVVL